MSGMKRLDEIGPMDPKTGVATLEALQRFLDPMMLFAHRSSQMISAIVALVDPDAAADGSRTAAMEHALCSLAELLKTTLRPYDLLARYDEWGLAMVLLCADEASAAQVAERIRQQVAQDARFAVGVSIGVAAISFDTLTSDELLAHAWDAARRAQIVGGNRVWKHTDTLAEISRREIDTRDLGGPRTFDLE